MTNNVITFYTLCTYKQLYSSVWVVEPYYINMLTHKTMLKVPALVLNLKRNMWALDNMVCSVMWISEDSYYSGL
jgi:hypothetical protein